MFCCARLDLSDPHVAPASSAITPRPLRLGVIFSGFWGLASGVWPLGSGLHVDSLAFVGYGYWGTRVLPSHVVVLVECAAFETRGLGVDHVRDARRHRGSPGRRAG